MHHILLTDPLADFSRCQMRDIRFLADRTNGHAYWYTVASVCRLSSSV